MIELRKFGKLKIMNQNIEVIYENGILRPLAPLNYPEKSVLRVDVRDVQETENKSENSAGSNDQARDVLRKAGLLSEPKFNLPKTKISDKRRKELAEIFSAEKPLGDYIDEDREGRG